MKEKIRRRLQQHDDTAFAIMFEEAMQNQELMAIEAAENQGKNFNKLSANQKRELLIQTVEQY